VGIDEKREFCEIVKDHLVDLILYCLGLTGLEYLGTVNNYDARVFSIWTITITITLLFHIAKRGCSATVNPRNSPGVMLVTPVENPLAHLSVPRPCPQLYTTSPMRPFVHRCSRLSTCLTGSAARHSAVC